MSHDFCLGQVKGEDQREMGHWGQVIYPRPSLSPYRSGCDLPAKVTAPRWAARVSGATPPFTPQVQEMVATPWC